jgi:hypothetical protein
MATIITVHGTNASGPEAGQKWSQKGSDFESHIRELVASDDGQLAFQPHIWDGANSELSRRRGGKALYERIAAPETASAPYVLIGHSHGGSVIAAALAHAARKRDPLATLGKWITIGTPFIKWQKHLFLFSRLGTLGKSIYSSLAMFLLLFVVVEYGTAQYSSQILLNYQDFGPMVGWVGLFCVCLFVGAHYLNSGKYYFYRKTVKAFLSSNFRDRCLSLLHKNDEAINGLRRLMKIEPPIFGKHFAVPALSSAALVAFPFMMYWFLALYTYAVTGNFGVTNFFVTFVKAVLGVPVWVASLIYPQTSDLLSMLGVIVFIIIGTAAGYLIVLVISRLLSNILCRIMNAATWKQVRKNAFGDDAIGEESLDSLSEPDWMLSRPFDPIPDELEMRYLPTVTRRPPRRYPNFGPA